MEARPSREVHHAAAVGLNGKLYVLGGYIQGWSPTNAVYEYDPASQRWRKMYVIAGWRENLVRCGARSTGIQERAPLSVD